MIRTINGQEVEKKILVIPDERLKYLKKLVEEEPKDESECLHEDNTISFQVNFDDGMWMDIKVCGVQYQEGETNTAWTEAVLFDHEGYELVCTDIDDMIDGLWEIEYDNGKKKKTYQVEVVCASDIITGE